MLVLCDIQANRLCLYWKAVVRRVNHVHTNIYSNAKNNTGASCGSRYYPLIVDTGSRFRDEFSSDPHRKPANSMKLKHEQQRNDCLHSCRDARTTTTTHSQHKHKTTRHINSETHLAMTSPGKKGQSAAAKAAAKARNANEKDQKRKRGETSTGSAKKPKKSELSQEVQEAALQEMLGVQGTVLSPFKSADTSAVIREDSMSLTDSPTTKTAAPTAVQDTKDASQSTTAMSPTQPGSSDEGEEGQTAFDRLSTVMPPEEGEKKPKAKINPVSKPEPRFRFRDETSVFDFLKDFQLPTIFPNLLDLW
jgi:hypothetical protein